MSPDTSGARPRILVVDDEEAVRSLLTDFLGVLGYEVTCATNGLEALEAVRSTQPRVVLLDIRMPGPLTCDEILAAIVAGGVPVIVVSGSIDEAMQAHLREAGAFDLLAKPFTLPRLRQAVAAAEEASRRDRST